MVDLPPPLRPAVNPWRDNEQLIESIKIMGRLLLSLLPGFVGHKIYGSERGNTRKDQALEDQTLEQRDEELA